MYLECFLSDPLWDLFAVTSSSPSVGLSSLLRQLFKVLMLRISDPLLWDLYNTWAANCVMGILFSRTPSSEGILLLDGKILSEIEGNKIERSPRE